MNIEELHERVERKTETVKSLEALLEKEDAELVELERKLESLEDAREQEGHEPVPEAQKPKDFGPRKKSFRRPLPPIDKRKSQ